MPIVLGIVISVDCEGCLPDIVQKAEQGEHKGRVMSHFFTRASHARTMAELTKLRQELIAVSRAKNVAAAEGDLSENAEYHAASEKLTMVQRRIHEVETQLASPRFIEELNINSDKVSIGTKVVCLNLDTDEEVVYTILGPADAVPEKNIISHQSPLARGFIGKELDEEITIEVPSGKRNFLILDIKRFDE
jgi:transcription elongation factor GreA